MMPHGYPIGMGEAEPVSVREGGRWSDIMAAPLDDDAHHRPLEFEDEEPDLPPGYLDTGDPASELHRFDGAASDRGPVRYD